MSCNHTYGMYISEDNYVIHISDTTDLKRAEKAHDHILFDFCPECGKKVEEEDITE